MAKKAAEKEEKRKEISQKMLEKLISKGKQKGFLTYDEINKALPEEMLSLEQIDEKDQKSIVASMAIEDSKWDYTGCLAVLTRFESIRNKSKKSLIAKIKEAEENNDYELLEKLLNEKQKMAVLTEKKKMTPLK